MEISFCKSEMSLQKLNCKFNAYSAGGQSTSELPGGLSNIVKSRNVNIKIYVLSNLVNYCSVAESTLKLL